MQAEICLVRDIARASPAVSKDTMQATCLVSHKVKILHESLPASFGLRSQDLAILDKAGKVVVISLEATNQFFPFCFTKGSANTSPFPCEAILKTTLGWILRFPFRLPIVLVYILSCET